MEKLIKNFKTWTNLPELVKEGILPGWDKLFLKCKLGGTTNYLASKLTTKLEASSLKRMDNLFGLIANNKINFFEDSVGTVFLKSSTGLTFPASQFENGLEAVIDGHLAVDEFIKLLPAKLADGTEFKKIIETDLKNVSTRGMLKGSSKNLIKYSPKMHDDFLKFENWLKSNPYVDDIFEFPFFTLKNKNGASLLSIKDIESTYVLGANDLERVFTQQEATALIKALQDKLQPKILAEWRPTPNDGFTPVKRINDLIYNIKTAWGL